MEVMKCHPLQISILRAEVEAVKRHPLQISILRAEVEVVKRHPFQILILRGEAAKRHRLTYQSAVGRFICALMVSMKWRIATAAGWPSPGGA